MSVPTSTPEDFAALQPDSIKAVLEGFDPSLAGFSRPARDLLLQDRRWDAGKAFEEMTAGEQSRFVETTAASLFRMSGCDHALALCSDRDYWTIAASRVDETKVFVGLEGKNPSVSALIEADLANGNVKIKMLYDEGIYARYTTNATNDLTQLTIISEKQLPKPVFRRWRLNLEAEVTDSTTTGAKSDFVFLRDSFAGTQKGDFAEQLKKQILANQASRGDPSAGHIRASTTTADPEEWFERKHHPELDTAEQFRLFSLARSAGGRAATLIQASHDAVSSRNP